MIDRKFFREQYNQEQILRQLIEEVKGLDSIGEMSKCVTEQVEQALHPTRIQLFYRNGNSGGLCLSYASNDDWRNFRIPEEFSILRLMEMHARSQDVPLPERQHLASIEREWLAQSGAELIVPMAGTDRRLEGLLLLGPKKSEVPYTAGDRELLETLASQIAIVYENVRLKERVDHDRRITREVLARVDQRKFNLLKECPRCGGCYDCSAAFCETDASQLVLTLPVERTIEGRYRLDHLIGKGGMGAVYEAQDLRLNRRVAVKILTGALFGDSSALRRFEREAQALGSLSHPNIIAVHDYGLLGAEGAFLVMELARGQTLRARLMKDGVLQSGAAAVLFDQVLEGVKAAHTAGIVHRDLKPENILLEASEDGSIRARLVDFGLAKLTAVGIPSPPDAAGATLTTPGIVMGTLGYMSPEQLTGSEVDERSDLFSIGVMIFEALIGYRPFRGSTHHELLTSILRNPIQFAETPPEGEHLCIALEKCLAIESAARFASAAEMQSEIIPAIRECPRLASCAADDPNALTVALVDQGLHRVNVSTTATIAASSGGIV